MQLFQFGAHGAHGGIEARRFVWHLVRRHDMAFDLERGIGHQMCVADGNAARNADAVNGEARGCHAIDFHSSLPRAPHNTGQWQMIRNQNLGSGAGPATAEAGLRILDSVLFAFAETVGNQRL